MSCAESMIYNVCACCICNTEQNIPGCATLCVCGADFDYATFTLCGIYKNKGTEDLSLHAIDSNNLTLQYADNTCFTQIKIDEEISFLRKKNDDLEKVILAKEKQIQEYEEEGYTNVAILKRLDKLEKNNKN